MKIMGTAFEMLAEPMFLESFDPMGDTANAVELTAELEFAKKFDSFKDVMRYWKTRSKKLPTRPDGKPNRPLTMFTIEPLEIEPQPA